MDYSLNQYDIFKASIVGQNDVELPEAPIEIRQNSIDQVDWKTRMEAQIMYTALVTGSLIIDDSEVNTDEES